MTSPRRSEVERVAREMYASGCASKQYQRIARIAWNAGSLSPDIYHHFRTAARWHLSAVRRARGRTEANVWIVQKDGRPFLRGTARGETPWMCAYPEPSALRGGGIMNTRRYRLVRADPKRRSR